MTKQSKLQLDFDNAIECQLYLTDMKFKIKKDYGNFNKAIKTLAEENKKLDKELTKIRTTINDPF